MRVRSGLEVLVAKRAASLKGKRVGLICHQASVDSRLRHAIRLLQEKGVNVTTLFAPEHGLWGIAQDQVEIPDDSAERGTQKSEQGRLNKELPSSASCLPAGKSRTSSSALPIYSLYGEQRFPSEQMLRDVEVLICDLQDVGSRYYTFIWTMALAMQACAKYGRHFVVVDRPNPINGNTLEGPVLDPEFASFVGLYPVPVRHGLTIGEIALWLNERFEIGARLEVIPMDGWRRAMSFEDSGLPWVLPSPNMPTLETAWVYPGGCLIEGTQLSEGRGTTRPFELLGAPYLPADKLADMLNEDKLPGVLFRACRFEPTFHKFQGQSCGGIQLHVTERDRFKPFFTMLRVLQHIQHLCPNDFAWRPPPYEYETQKLPIDILCGNSTIRQAIEQDQPLKRLEEQWQDSLRAFAQERQPFLLYN